MTSIFNSLSSKSSDESMDENDNNKFTLMALSPVNRNDQRILDTFA